MQNRSQQNPPENPAPKPPKRMIGCLSIWLWLVIILNVSGIIVGYVRPDLVQTLSQPLPTWYLPLSAVVAAFIVIFALALLKWKAWGFWGLVAMEGISVIASIAAWGEYFTILSGVVNVAILVMLLNIGGRNKAWNLLE
jgi:hypothetical protein